MHACCFVSSNTASQLSKFNGVMWFLIGQAYVALSRVRSLRHLQLTTPLDRQQIKAHPRVMAFYQQLQPAA